MAGQATLRRSKGAGAESGKMSRLFLVIQETVYGVDPVECDRAAAQRAFRLRKPDGTLYDVAQTQLGPRCDCPDFIFRRDGLDPTGCKHVKALVAQGMIEGETASTKAVR